MNEKDYAVHMMSWIDKLVVPYVDPVKIAYSMAKVFWIDELPQDFEGIKIKLWDFIDSNGGPRITDEAQMTKVRMIMCVVSESVEEVQDMGFFEDLLVRLGYSFEEAYAGT